MTRTPHLAQRIASVAALGALTIAACAAQAAAGPTRSTGNGSSQAPYPGFPSAPVTRHAHATQVPQLQVHTQQRGLAPIYMPVAWSPINTGVFGGGFMNGFMPTSCSDQSAPMTLGELAPGGDTDFAPVSHSMIDPSSAGDPSWMDSLTGSSTYNMPQAPFQGPMGLTGGSQTLGGLSARCAPGASAFGFTDVQLGL